MFMVYACLQFDTICLYIRYIYTIVYDIHIHPFSVKIGDGLLGNPHFSKLSLSTPGSGVGASTDIWLPSSDLGSRSRLGIDRIEGRILIWANYNNSLI